MTVLSMAFILYRFLQCFLVKFLKQPCISFIMKKISNQNQQRGKSNQEGNASLLTNPASGCDAQGQVSSVTELILGCVAWVMRVT